LLGRPSVFASDAEQDEALHARRQVLENERRIPGMPDYKECHLLPFDMGEIKLFVGKYIDLLKTHGDTETSPDSIEKFMKLLRRRQGVRLVELAARPVQLKMLMEVLPGYGRDMDSLTTAILYSEFIDLVIRRELTKEARKSFSIVERRRFASLLCYWMWEAGGGRTQINASELPSSLFDTFVSMDTPVDLAKRDLLTGCFLERKPPDGLYLSHRSFLEFLVAERLVEMIKVKDDRILSLPYVSEEIVRFFTQLIGDNAFHKWYQWMWALKGVRTVSEQSVRLFEATCRDREVVLPERFFAMLAGKEWATTSLAASGPALEDIPELKLADIQKRQHKSPHRLTGVTKKKQFRAR
jgi:hypothetical protein